MKQCIFRKKGYRLCKCQLKYNGNLTICGRVLAVTMAQPTATKLAVAALFIQKLNPKWSKNFFFIVEQAYRYLAATQCQRADIFEKECVSIWQNIYI